MNVQSSGRKQYLDIAKGIGIVLVVLGHCPHVYNPLKQWIYAFHMPLFFIISGMVWNKESHERRGYFSKEFVIDRLRRLIVPCYIWGIFYMLLNAVLNKSFSPINIVYLFYGSQSGFSHAGSLTSLWFLPCMFLSVCIFELIQMMLGKNNNKVALFLISFVFVVVGIFLPRISGGFPWCVDVMFLAVAFMLWGYLGRDLIEGIDKPIVLATIAAVAFILLTLTYKLNLLYVGINNADMAGRYFGNPFLYLVDAFAGSVTVLMLSKLMEASKLISRYLGYLGKITIPIFIIHKPVVQAIDKVLSGVGIPDVAIVTVSVFLSIGVSVVVNMVVNQFIPAIFGETNRA